jgi:hypothetical protein
MLNLNYNTTFTSLNSQPRAINNYNYSASIWVIGGGGGGGSVNGTTNPYVPGGGGGAGAAVSASVSIIPNLSYTIVVGQSGSRDTDGSDSRLLGWDGVDSQTLGIFAQGGRKGGLFVGGNAGSGSVVRITTQLFPANTGASGSGTYPNFGAGGGAGSTSNGVTSTPNSGGNGGSGSASPLIGIVAGDFVSLGGGGGGGLSAATAGLPNGGAYQQNGFSGSLFGDGGGGAGAEPEFGGDSIGGPGYPGVVVITYSGKQKAFGGTIYYNTGSNQTTHYYTSSGQFLYTYPYPWEDVPSGSFPQ